MLGGLIWLLPNVYFAYRVFHKIETQAKNFIGVFYRTELFKLALSAFLFVAIIKWLPVVLSAILVGYLAAQVTFWLVPLFDSLKH